MPSISLSPNRHPKFGNHTATKRSGQDAVLESDKNRKRNFPADKPIPPKANQHSTGIHIGMLTEQLDALPKLLDILSFTQQARRQFPNFSHRHYGAAVEMSNGITAYGTNIEINRQTAFCDLRAALTMALNQSVGRLFNKPASSNASPLTVKNVFLVNADLSGDSPIPCADCQEWMTGKFFTPQTRLISLEERKAKHLSSPAGVPPEELRLNIRTLADLLPLHQGRKRPQWMTTQQEFSRLPLKMSPQAKTLLSENAQSLTRSQMQNMLRKAKTEFEKKESDSLANPLTTGMKTGVCVLTDPRAKLYSQGRFQWSTRWPEAPDLRAVVKSLDEQASLPHWFQNLGTFSWLPLRLKQFFNLDTTSKPSVKAIAYYGNRPIAQPSIASLGRIVRRLGTADIMILTIEDDVIHCRTIQDFMPEIYRAMPQKSG
jgi:cytidine deaminase